MHENVGRRRVEMLNKENKHNLSDFTEFTKNGKTNPSDWLQTDKQREGKTMYLVGGSEFQRTKERKNTEFIDISEVTLQTNTKKIIVNERLKPEGLEKNSSEQALKKMNDTRAYNSVSDNKISEETVMKVKSYLNSRREACFTSDHKNTPSKSVDSKFKAKKVTSVTVKRPSRISDGVIDVNYLND